MGFLIDLRYALRLLAKSPKFTVLTSFILMGGLAVSLVTFNFVFTMALKPLATPEGDSLVTIAIEGDYPGESVQASDIAKMDKAFLQQLYAEYSFTYFSRARMSVDNVGMNLSIERADSHFFDLTRFEPALGRAFTESDAMSGNTEVAAIAYHVWQSMFNGDDAVIGQTVLIDQKPVEIIAVMPEGYRFPVNSDMWLPIQSAFWSSVESANTEVSIFARLNDGVSAATADNLMAQWLTEQRMQVLSESEKADFEWIDVQHLSLPAHRLRGDARMMFLTMQGLAFVILLMACINTANLIFARSIERQKESAIRAALGAKQYRIVRQLVCEGGLLVLLGGFFAVLLSGWLLDVLNKVMHASASLGMPFWFKWQLDWQTVLVAVLFMLVTFVFACLIPAVKAANLDINTVLRDGTRGALGRGAGKVSRVLVTVQVSIIACLMLVGSLGVVLMYKMTDMISSNPGQNRFAGEFVLEDVDAESFVQNLLVQLKAQNHIVDTGVQQNIGAKNIRLHGQPLDNAVDIYAASGNVTLFEANITEGRDIDARDSSQSSPVALVSESFAQRHWPGLEAIGQMLDVELDGQYKPHRVVGVVSDIGYNTQGVFAQAQEYDEIYLSYFQYPQSEVEVTLVTSQLSEEGKEAFYRVLFAQDAVDMLVDFEDREASGDAFVKIIKVLSSIIIYAGLFALFLALMGVFGVAASNVALRRQEIGIRRAIGAKDNAIIKLFLKRNMVPLIIGLTIGLGVYGAVSFVFSNIVGNRIEAATYITIALVTGIVLSSILCLAAYFPTRTAIVNEPSEALRAD